MAAIFIHDFDPNKFTDYIYTSNLTQIYFGKKSKNTEFFQIKSLKIRKSYSMNHLIASSFLMTYEFHALTVNILPYTPTF